MELLMQGDEHKVSLEDRRCRVCCGLTNHIYDVWCSSKCREKLDPLPHFVLGIDYEPIRIGVNVWLAGESEYEIPVLPGRRKLTDGPS